MKENQGTFEPSKELDAIEFTEWEGQRLPACPKGWDFPMQEFWNHRCRDLQSAGYLTRAFLEPLRRYCEAVNQARLADDHLREEGHVTTRISTKGNEYEVINPWLTVLEKANKEIDKFGSKLGLTPLDAQKIPAIKKEAKTMSLLK